MEGHLGLTLHLALVIFPQLTWSPICVEELQCSQNFNLVAISHWETFISFLLWTYCLWWEGDDLGEFAVPNECVDKTKSLHHFPTKDSLQIYLGIGGIPSFSEKIHFSLFCVCALEMVSLHLHLWLTDAEKMELMVLLCLFSSGAVSLIQLTISLKAVEKMTVVVPRLSPDRSCCSLTTFLCVIPPVVTAMPYLSVNQVSWMGTYLYLFLKYF